MEISVPERLCFSYIRRHLPLQLLLKMKLTASILLITCMHVSAHSYSQTISFSGKNVSLQTVFSSIEKQTGLSFFFNYALIKDAKPVTLNLREVTLEAALHEVLKDQGLDFYRMGKTIFVVKKEPVTSANPVAPSVSTEGRMIDVKGRVTDQQGNPLVGATVTIRDAKKVTLTDERGMFELKSVPIGSILEVTYLGYERKETPVEEMVKVEMAAASNKLDEVQVIAYGNTTERMNTGDVTTIKAQDIEKQPVSNALLALEGRVPGMFITQSTGFSGTGIVVRIRGQNSISNGNDPLYIIDGVPYGSQLLPGVLANGIFGSNGASTNIKSTNPLNFINPANIESINVLKDADATAIYGSRGANGVVFITTKKGKNGSIKGDINVQNGWGKITHKMDLLNTQQYLQMRHEAFNNDGVVPQSSDYDLTLWDTTRNTDWQKGLIGETSQYTDAQINFSGGDANTQYLIGGGYHKETTVFPGDFNDQKGSLNFNITSISNNQKFHLLLSSNYLNDNNQLPISDITQQALQLAPDAPASYNTDGSFNWAHNTSGTATWANPLASLTPKFKKQTNNLVSNAALSYLLLPGLEIKSNLGYTYIQSNDVQTSPLTRVDPALWVSSTRSAAFANSSANSWIVEPQVIYTLNMGSGGLLTALLGSTIQQSRSNGYTLNATGANSDLILENIQAATSITASSPTNTLYKYNAVFGRLKYNWQDKYIVDLTIRRDGSSRFGPAKQFHDFGAAGVGWIFSKESFFQKRLPFLSFGKLRASYGTTGNDQIGDYSFIDLYNVTSVGVPYQTTSGLLPSKIFIPDLAWEQTRKLEGGIELGYLKDKIILNASFYQNRSSNELTTYSLPSITGFTSLTRNLPALVQNEGWEFDLRTININSKNFRWVTSVNLTLNRNKLISGTPGLNSSILQKVGHSLSSSFVYHFQGVDPTTGIYQVSDIHDNPAVVPNTTSDIISLIDLAPKYYGGFDNSISFKGLELSFLFQFVKQLGRNYLYNLVPGYFNNGSGNQPITVLSRWQKPGQNSSIQRFNQNLNNAILNGYSYVQTSDQFYSDGSYIRLKNLSFSWKLPKSWMQKTHFQNVRLFVQGQNLLTFTHFQGLDPETLTNTTLPPLRVWTFGVQLGL